MVARAGLSSEIDHAPGEFEVGGVTVTVC